jgi:hypothetical protein
MDGWHAVSEDVLSSPLETLARSDSIHNCLINLSCYQKCY